MKPTSSLQLSGNVYWISLHLAKTHKAQKKSSVLLEHHVTTKCKAIGRACVDMAAYAQAVAEEINGLLQIHLLAILLLALLGGTFSAALLAFL